MLSTHSKSLLRTFSSIRCFTVSPDSKESITSKYGPLENEVVYLKRVQFNKLVLDQSLQVGECRELTAEELLLLDVNK